MSKRTKMVEVQLANHPGMREAILNMAAEGVVLPCDCSKCKQAKLPRKRGAVL